MKPGLRLVQKQVQKQKQKMKAALKYAAVGVVCTAVVGGIAFTVLNLGPSDDARAGATIKDPVKLRYFEAEVLTDGVSLKWRTLIETENDHFTVERSVDGKEFEIIAVIQGAGFSESRKDYNFVDADPLLGNSYYRLGKTNFEGQTVYSEPVLVASNKLAPVKIVDGGQNKATGKAEITFDADNNADITVKLTDVTGHEVYSKIIKPLRGRNTVCFEDITKLAGGVYMAHIEQDSFKSNTFKVVKIK